MPLWGRTSPWSSRNSSCTRSYGLSEACLSSRTGEEMHASAVLEARDLRTSVFRSYMEYMDTWVYRYKRYQSFWFCASAVSSPVDYIVRFDNALLVVPWARRLAPQPVQIYCSYEYHSGSMTPVPRPPERSGETWRRLRFLLLHFPSGDKCVAFVPITPSTYKKGTQSSMPPDMETS